MPFVNVRRRPKQYLVFTCHVIAITRIIFEKKHFKCWNINMPEFNIFNFLVVLGFNVVVDDNIVDFFLIKGNLFLFFKLIKFLFSVLISFLIFRAPFTRFTFLLLKEFFSFFNNLFFLAANVVIKFTFCVVFSSIGAIVVGVSEYGPSLNNCLN